MSHGQKLIQANSQINANKTAAQPSVGSSSARSARPKHPACSRQRQLDPACRLYVTQRDDLEPVAELGIAAANSGSKVALGSNLRRHQKGQILLLPTLV